MQRTEKSHFTVTISSLLVQQCCQRLTDEYTVLSLIYLQLAAWETIQTVVCRQNSLLYFGLVFLLRAYVVPQWKDAGSEVVSVSVKEALLKLMWNVVVTCANHQMVRYDKQCVLFCVSPQIERSGMHMFSVQYIFSYRYKKEKWHLILTVFSSFSFTLRETWFYAVDAVTIWYSSQISLVMRTCFALRSNFLQNSVNS